MSLFPKNIAGNRDAFEVGRTWIQAKITALRDAVSGKARAILSSAARAKDTLATATRSKVALFGLAAATFGAGKAHAQDAQPSLREEGKLTTSEVQTAKPAESRESLKTTTTQTQSLNAWIRKTEKKIEEMQKNGETEDTNGWTVEDLRKAIQMAKNALNTNLTEYKRALEEAKKSSPEVYNLFLANNGHILSISVVEDWEFTTGKIYSASVAGMGNDRPYETSATANKDLLSSQVTDKQIQDAAYLKALFTEHLTEDHATQMRVYDMPGWSPEQEAKNSLKRLKLREGATAKRWARRLADKEQNTKILPYHNALHALYAQGDANNTIKFSALNPFAVTREHVALWSIANVSSEDAEKRPSAVLHSLSLATIAQEARNPNLREADGRLRKKVIAFQIQSIRGPLYKEGTQDLAPQGVELVEQLYKKASTFFVGGDTGKDFQEIVTAHSIASAGDKKTLEEEMISKMAVLDAIFNANQISEYSREIASRVPQEKKAEFTQFRAELRTMLDKSQTIYALPKARIMKALDGYRDLAVKTQTPITTDRAMQEKMVSQAISGTFSYIGEMQGVVIEEQKSEKKVAQDNEKIAQLNKESARAKAESAKAQAEITKAQAESTKAQAEITKAQAESALLEDWTIIVKKIGEQLTELNTVSGDRKKEVALVLVTLVQQGDEVEKKIIAINANSLVREKWAQLREKVLQDIKPHLSPDEQLKIAAL